MPKMRQFLDEDNAVMWIDVDLIQHTRSYTGTEQNGETYPVTRVEAADYCFYLRIGAMELAHICGWLPLPKAKGGDAPVNV